MASRRLAPGSRKLPFGCSSTGYAPWRVSTRPEKGRGEEGQTDVDTAICATTLICMKDAFDLSLCTQCHCLAARRNARAITRVYEEHLRPHGLRATQFSILVALAVAGPKPMGELAEALGLDRTTLTRGVALLERDGWLATEPSDDARERRLRLTKAGRKKLESAYPAWKAAQEAVGKKLRDSSPASTGR